MEKSQARKVWDHIIRLKNPFTANEVADKTGVNTQTVRHYFGYWKEKGAMEADGKIEEIGKRGRPRTTWACLTKEFISVWRVAK